MNLQESITRISREELLNESDPKTGTGKKPKGLSYTQKRQKNRYKVNETNR